MIRKSSESVTLAYYSHRDRLNTLFHFAPAWGQISKIGTNALLGRSIPDHEIASSKHNIDAYIGYEIVPRLKVQEEEPASILNTAP